MVAMLLLSSVSWSDLSLDLPLYLLTWKIAPTIAADNAVIVKSSELTPVTMWVICKLLEKAGN